jgi:hypothetical protein
MRGAITPFPLYIFMAWCLVKHRDNFTFIINHHTCVVYPHCGNLLGTAEQVSVMHKSKCCQLPFVSADSDDDDDPDGLRNVGSVRTPDAADSLRRLHQMANV